ncbi:aminotransferase class IV [Anaeromicropila populeti]|uniref:4-amino-4-deoxychorismate lyase n=1 Tax=Anaeromicropila populeti TaxID=37658 RepID=A0A1I6JWE2_9FIRM|nr:aminotransferase class IV [Anaeromicropila populeti]SFR83309.1 4-amino-4-deoxychorismate lyase [Anaeromicropila populeti]
MEKIYLDEGYTFGLGVFETIAVENNKPLFLKEHLERMENALICLDIEVGEMKWKIEEEAILKFVKGKKLPHNVVKIMVSSQNVIYATSQNLYTSDCYEKGFSVDYTNVLRNETSELTYYKTFNYGDNIKEKRRAKKKGFDEPIFINTKGQITEGSTTNLFFVRNKKIMTPPVSCGMLNGVLRQYIIKTHPVEERIIYPDDVSGFDEMFLTNSLMGIMPVRSCGKHSFLSTEVTKQMRNQYLNDINCTM